MALTTPSLPDLASAISLQVSTITKFLRDNEFPQPSFDVDGGREREFPANPEIEQAYMGLIESASDLLHLALGPKRYMALVPLYLHNDHLAFLALSHYNVYDAVPLEGSITYTELAKKCNAPEARLRRFLQHAMTNRIFWSPTPDSVAHTITSAEVVRSPLMYAWMDHNLQEIAPASLKVIDALEKYGDSQDPAQAGMAVNFNLDVKGEQFFQLLENDGAGEPKTSEGEVDKTDRTKGWRARRFGEAMKFMTTFGVSSAKHIHGGFDWDALGKATVVDCGGSTGHVMVELASKHPDLTMIVQDFAALEPQFDATIPEKYKSRISFQAHDFFTPQPIKGADVYFFKHVLHDWPDASCVKILKNVVPAMKSGSRIILMEGVLAEVGQVPNSVAKLGTALDLQMMAALNARERKAEDWKALFKAADERLVVKAIRQPPGSMASLIEVGFEH